MARTAKAGDIRLPNAPLVEAVFELRWALQGPAGTPWHTDPGFLPMRESFTKNVARLGFTEVRDMVGPQDFLVGNAIARRYYLGKDQDFPLMQMGPGIFATNQSAEYDWSRFRKQVLNGIRVVLASYPQLPNFPLNPNYLELRYVDAFDSTTAGSSDFVRFMSDATNMRLNVPPFLALKKVLGDQRQGRVLLHTTAKGWKASQFIFDLGSGRRQEELIVRLETKVVTAAEGAPKLKKPQAFLSSVAKWLEFAHGITSPFFKDFVKDSVMAKFKRID